MGWIIAPLSPCAACYCSNKQPLSPIHQSWVRYKCMFSPRQSRFMPPKCKDTTSYSTSPPSYFVRCLVLSHNPFRQRHLVYVPPEETKTFHHLPTILPLLVTHFLTTVSCFYSFVLYAPLYSKSILCQSVVIYNK